MLKLVELYNGILMEELVIKIHNILASCYVIFVDLPII